MRMSRPSTNLSIFLPCCQTLGENDCSVSPSFGTAASTKLATVAAHSVARGAKRRGEVRRIASPSRPSTPLPALLQRPKQFLWHIEPGNEQADVNGKKLWPVR